ncbi:glycosyltransferase family 2 protein, partial [Candidatus Shapirobacteria bacterium]|nr:glycosyltransferase family 2 protein [Candidatus Shapirobacteria bacterium]
MKKLSISVVVNTLNEEKNLSRCLSSVEKLADEIVVVDMYSDDQTREIARKFGARVFLHEKLNYVEPARNFAIEKARGKWIFILDADEKITSSLAKKLKEIAWADKGEIDYVLIPRKNIIFGKWIQNSRWWPDYLPRFFKKGKIDWPAQIHQQPELKGNILTLPDVEKFAITHYNYDSLDQYLSRAQRYAKV